MDTIHIPDIEDYQPTYKDGRRLIWIRWDIDAIHSYKISRLSEAQRWLFIGLICLETRNQKPIPKDMDWVAHQLKYSSKIISRDINKLLEFGLIETTQIDLKKQATVTKQKPEKDMDKIKEIIDDLNKVCDRNFKHDNQQTIAYIQRRLGEGYSVEDFKRVHASKHKDWKNKKDMQKFLRPETLYSNKFEGYLNQKTDKDNPLGDFEV